MLILNKEQTKDSLYKNEVFKNSTFDCSVDSNDIHADLVSLMKVYEHKPGWIILVAPEGTPPKQYFVKHGLDVNKIIVIPKRYCNDVSYTVLQALKYNNCSAIIFWENEISVQMRLSLTQEALNTGVNVHSINNDALDGELQFH